MPTWIKIGYPTMHNSTSWVFIYNQPSDTKHVLPQNYSNLYRKTIALGITMMSSHHDYNILFGHNYIHYAHCGLHHFKVMHFM